MFQGRTVAVVGVGKSGEAAARLLLSRGATVVAFDERPDAALALTHPKLRLVAGPLPERFFEGASAVVVSPGVPLSKPAFARARAAGVPVYGEVELAFRCMPRGAGPVLGITGTNGKSTTTALLGELVRQHAPDAFVGGNLGTAFSLAYVEPSQPPLPFHVVELSSFQLEGLVEAQVTGAALLNLQPDHLDRYPSHEAYGLAKARIFERQPAGGFAVVNADDAAVVVLSRRATAPVYGFTLDATRAKGDFAGLAVAEQGGVTLGFAGGGRFELRNRALRGAHNAQNAAAAISLAALAGIPREAIQRGLDAFPGLPHRLEWVREVDGVEYVNDSKATNVDSVLVALAAFDRGLWLIAGGKGKGAPYAPMVEAGRRVVRGVLTIGADAPVLARAYEGVCPVVPCGDLETAVAEGRRRAKAGEVVLLSPACASYDQFRNFEHRGDRFKELVRAL